jgi:hypothetical protein
MRHCKAWLESIPGSPYSQSAKHQTPMLDRESHDDYDIRTWRDKCTVNKDGQVCVPGMALKQAIDTAAYKLGEKVAGRRGATYKSFFASGFFCDGDVPIFNGKVLTKNDAESKLISANSDGVRGSGKRVPRRFPEFPIWHGVVEFTIVDDVITPEVFERHVKAAGIVVGIGRFRPEKGGTNGRFKVAKFEWSDLSLRTFRARHRRRFGRIGALALALYNASDQEAEILGPKFEAEIKQLNRTDAAGVMLVMLARQLLSGRPYSLDTDNDDTVARVRSLAAHLGAIVTEHESQWGADHLSLLVVPGSKQ